jgi:hypothetical protein
MMPGTDKDDSFSCDIAFCIGTSHIKRMDTDGCCAACRPFRTTVSGTVKIKHKAGEQLPVVTIEWDDY